MNQERWRLIERIFHSAREHGFAERAAFLRRACGEDDDLRDEISSRLRESDDAGDFLAESALPIGVSLLTRLHGVSPDGTD